MSHYDCPECPSLHNKHASLRARLEELERAVHNQNLETDGQTFAGKVLENQKLLAEMERLKFIEAAWIALKSASKYTPGGDLWPRAERVVELENEILKLRHERDEVLEEVKRLRAQYEPGT